MKESNFKLILIYSFAVLSGALEASAIGSFGLFQDTEIYYQIYKNVQEDGFLSAISVFFVNTGKFEPLIFFVFWIAGLGFGYILEEKEFLFVFLCGINILLSIVWVKVQTIEKIKYKHILFLMVILLGYLIFSKALYFWRSILAMSFFVMYIYASNKVRYVYLVAAILSHSTFIVFYFLFSFTSFFLANNRYVLFKCIGLSVGIALVLTIAPGFLSFMVSGGDVEVFVAEGAAHSIVVWSTIIYSLVILFLIRREMLSSLRHKDFYCFLIVIGMIAALMLDSYHLMNRVFLPLSIMVGFLTVVCVRKSNELTIARVLIFLSVFPTLRLMFNLYTGQFVFS